MGRESGEMFSHWGAILSLVVAAAICHLNWPITGRISIDLVPLLWMVAIYAGYKYGRGAGLLVGATSVLLWGLAYSLFEASFSWRSLIFHSYSWQPFGGDVYVFASAYSLSDALLAGSAGFAAGAVFDVIDRRLRDAGGSLNQLLPIAVRRGPLAWLFAFGERWLSAGGADVAPVSLRGAARKVTVAALLAALVVANLQLQLAMPPIHLTLPPHLLAGLVTLAVAFFVGSAEAISLAVMFWIAARVVLLDGLAGLSREGDDASVRLSISSIAQLVGLCIMAWWSGRLGDAMRDQERWALVERAWSSIVRFAAPSVRPPIALAILLLLLSASVRVDLTTLRIAYEPFFAWFVVLAIVGSKREPATVSTYAFWLLLLLAVVYSQGGADVDERATLFAFSTFHPNMVQVVLLAATPLAAGQLELRRLDVCRALSFGFLFAWTVAGIYLDDNIGHTGQVLGLTYLIPPSTTGLIVVTGRGVGGFTLPVISWLLQLLLFEFAARWIHLFQGNRAEAVSQ